MSKSNSENIPKGISNVFQPTISLLHRFHDIYYDGESHYYIDGTVIDGGYIPVLLVDTDEDKYYQVTESGINLVFPYEEWM